MARSNVILKRRIHLLSIFTPLNTTFGQCWSEFLRLSDIPSFDLENLAFRLYYTDQDHFSVHT